MNYKLFLICSVVATALLLTSLGVTAQSIKPNRWLVSVDGGVSVFFGDVKRYEYLPDHESPSEIKPMFRFNLGKEISPIFSLRGQFLYGDISGHKKKAKYNFKGTTLAGHLIADFNLIYLFTNNRFGRSKINAFAGIGFGYMSWDSKLYFDIPKADGTEIMAENKNGALSFPGSLSLEYMITDKLSVYGSGVLYVVNSDEVDAKVGGIKVDMVNYYNLGIAYRFKTKRKASRRNIKYRLEPSLYEPIEKDKPDELVEELVVENEVIEEIELPLETAIVANDVLDADKVENTNDKEAGITQEVAIVEKPNEFRINHELEKEAIKKETWASREDDIWSGIKFSVQVAATKLPRNTEELQEELGLKSTVYENYDGEWHRYSVGQYDKMWRAKELRNMIRSVNRIHDAFIVVYRYDERISLAEALNYTAKTRSVVHVQEESVVSEEEMKKVYPLIRLDQSIPQQGIIIGVQILSVRNDHYPLGVLSGMFGIDKDILVNVRSPWHKIIAVGFDDYIEALDFQEHARSKGFIDAFVVVFKDGKRISVTRLKSLQEK